MKLNIVQLNCLDLFIFLDNPLKTDISEITEDEWQSSTYSNRGNKPIDKIRDLAKSLKKLKADIILLNEVGGKESLENFNKLFLNDKYKVAISEGSIRGIDTGFLIKKGIQFYHQGFSKINIENKDYKFSRSINQVSIIKNNNKILNIFGVHLKSLGGNGNSANIIEQRFNEVKGLINIVKNARSQDGCPYIVMGDFNGNCTLKDHDFEFSYLYKKTSLRDIHDLNKSSNIDRYSFVRMYRDILEYNQLDYIMLSKDLHKKVKKVKRFLFNKDQHINTMSEKENLPSDHYPQFVKIYL